ncbi:MAG: CobW family GTP-binding protein [Thiobacillaceae bacterium]
MTADHRIPVTLLTGFLGSGKTTLLNRILRERPHTAVVMNEFGEVALDHHLVEGIEGPMAVLGGGCVCCTVQGSLAPTLKNLWMARAGGRIPAFERLILETTGLADPAAILATLLHDAWLARRYQMDGVVTTVDAQLGRETLARHPEAQRQAVVADRLVVTKADLASPEEIEPLVTELARLNPQATILVGSTSTLDVGPLLAIGGWQPQSDPAAVRAWLAAPRAHAAPALLTRGKPAAAHIARIQSFSLNFDEPLEWEGLLAALGMLVDFRGPQLLRMKAIVNVRGRPGPVVLHGAQHVFYPPQELPAWPDEDRASRFVFITDGLDPQLLQRMLAAFSQAARDGLIERAHNAYGKDFTTEGGSNAVS